MMRSGIGIHYAPSAIIDTKYQAAAKSMAIGERIVPQIIVRAADGRPFELQDLLPADVRFKLLVFSGDMDDELQRAAIDRVAADLGRVLRKFVGGDKLEDVFDVLTIW